MQTSIMSERNESNEGRREGRGKERRTREGGKEGSKEGSKQRRKEGGEEGRRQGVYTIHCQIWTKNNSTNSLILCQSTSVFTKANHAT